MTRLLWLTAFVTSLAASPRWGGAEEAAPLPPSHSVVPELYATGFEFAEGPALDRQGNLYVANYRGKGNIGRITTDGTASVFCNLDELAPVEGGLPQANGLKVDSEGRLLVADAGGGRLLRVAVDGSEVEVLADRWDQQRLVSVNDVALDLAGNIYFSDPAGSDADNPVGSVYRYDIKTQKTTRLATGLAFPNGLGITPDQKQLCVSESKKYRLLIYDLNDDATVTGGRTLIEFPADTTGQLKGGKFEPDGLVFDTRGRIYVGMWTGGVINVVDSSTGQLLRQYDAGGNKATNCHFHGPYLYTTVAAKEAVFRLKLGVEGLEYYGPGG